MALSCRREDESLQTGVKSRSGFSTWPFLRLVLDCGLASKPRLPSATPTRGHSRGRLQDRIFKFSQGRPPHLPSSLLKGCSQKAKVHQARASILKPRLDFAPVCIRQVRNPGLAFSRRPSLGTTWAPWSRDTCERLSGFYLVLGTT